MLERLNDDLTTVYATAGIADDPTPPAPAAAPATSTPRPGADPLRGLDPAHYVSVLTGQAVGRSRKVSCPFHDDRTPSFHVYERPEDGWYCFGCRRYGHTAYDLAAALWHLDTRGEGTSSSARASTNSYCPRSHYPRRRVAEHADCTRQRTGELALSDLRASQVAVDH